MSQHAEPHSHADDHDDDHHEQHGSLGLYLSVFVALLVLTLISFSIGSSEAIMSSPSLGWTIMMAVSCAKALLVMLFFMHLKWEANWKYVLTIPASVMCLFLVIMLSFDIGYRTFWYSEERWLHAATPQEHVEDDHAADSHIEHHDETEASQSSQH